MGSIDGEDGVDHPETVPHCGGRDFLAFPRGQQLQPAFIETVLRGVLFAEMADGWAVAG
jgi:hypothetical protein